MLPHLFHFRVKIVRIGGWQYEQCHVCKSRRVTRWHPDLPNVVASAWLPLLRRPNKPGIRTDSGWIKQIDNRWLPQQEDIWK